MTSLLCVRGIRLRMLYICGRQVQAKVALISVICEVDVITFVVFGVLAGILSKFDDLTYAQMSPFCSNSWYCYQGLQFSRLAGYVSRMCAAWLIINEVVVD